MENDTPSSSAPPHSGGAGGKFRKPPVSKKRPSTPYDRPSLTINSSKPDESQDGGGGWLSKLVVNPARRLIVGGATRILPSFFSNSSSADEYHDDLPRDHDDQDIDATQNACDDAKNPLKLEVSRSIGDAGPSSAVDRLKVNFEQIEQSKSKNSSGDLDLVKIENLVKGKQFSRDEINHLTEILNSRLVDVSTAEEEKASSAITEGQAKEDLLDHEITPPSIMENKYNMEKAVLETPVARLQSNMQDDVAASPIDIARAYMGNRTSELGLNYSFISKDSDMLPSKQYISTPSSKSSPCWPGAMVHDQRGYLSPQSEKGRYGLHNFPRTPYSRTIYSRTKPKLTQLQANSRSSNISLNPFQQSQTPNYGKTKARSDVMDGGYGGSVGPIRRVRNKFASEFSAQIASSPAQKPIASNSFVPIFQKNSEAAGTSSVHSVDRYEQTYKKNDSKSTGPSNETVRKILEQLDRHKPTPKEKANELKIATEWKKPPSQDTASKPKENIAFNLHGNGVLSGTDVRGTSNAVTKVSSSIAEDGYFIDAGAGPSFGLRNIGDSQIRSSDEKKQPSQPWSFDNRQDPTKNGKRSSQPPLKPISFKRPDPHQVISSDNSRGFTFPFSATANSASEPPTPSILPSFPATGDQSNIPTYSFGTTKTSQRVVFSFPSTSSATVKDSASDLKFNFGSDKKRVSFSSIGNNDVISIN